MVATVRVAVTPQTLRHTLATGTAILVALTGNQTCEERCHLMKMSISDEYFRHFLSSPTALFFIRAIGAVSLTIAQEGLWYTAELVVTAVVAALRQAQTIQLIRSVSTVVFTVAHLPSGDASIPMSTLKLSWETGHSLSEMPIFLRKHNYTFVVA